MSQDLLIKKTNIVWFFAIFFSTFIIVDICYIVIAEKTWRGLAIEDGYQKGLRYNQAIDIVKKQQKLGWKLQIDYQSGGKGIGDLWVKLLDKNNQSINGANITANIKNPIQDGMDFIINLKFNPSARAYKSSIQFPQIGQWDVEIVARRDKDLYQDIKRLIIR